MTEELEQAQDFLHRVQENTAKIVLHLNSDKTEFMSFNQAQDTVLETVNNENIKKVDNFKYLGVLIDDTANDVKVRKALARKVCNKLNKIWKSFLCKSLKLRTFLTLVESVLLYGSETWTLTKNIEKSIDDETYTRLLRMSWKVNISMVNFKYKDFFSIKKQITIISIIM